MGVVVQITIAGEDGVLCQKVGAVLFILVAFVLFGVYFGVQCL